MSATMSSARLARITVYPIKSLDGVEMSEANVLPCGALADDRRFAIVDQNGRVINGKRTPDVHRIRTETDLDFMQVQLRTLSEESSQKFSLTRDRQRLNDWFSEALGMACQVIENTVGGFPDDTEAPGPTVISTATLREVASWFPNLSLDEARRRFRANLEIDGVEPFWEDRLVGSAGTEVPFHIGRFGWLGVRPCQRCVVPARSSRRGQVTTWFQTTFVTSREHTLPSWAPADRFDHFYRLAVNTRLAPNQPSGRLFVGDPVRLG
jgi:hypothetical protein